MGRAEAEGGAVSTVTRGQIICYCTSASDFDAEMSGIKILKVDEILRPVGRLQLDFLLHKNVNTDPTMR